MLHIRPRFAIDDTGLVEGSLRCRLRIAETSGRVVGMIESVNTKARATFTTPLLITERLHVEVGDLLVIPGTRFGLTLRRYGMGSTLRRLFTTVSV